MSEKGKIKLICTGKAKGEAKHPIDEIEIIDDLGLKGDANAGDGDRQISLVSADKVNEFGRSEENIVIEDMDFSKLTIGALIQIGAVVLEVTSLGETLTEYVFTKVLNGGLVKKGSPVEIIFV